MVAVGLLQSELFVNSNFSFLISVESVTLNCHIIFVLIPWIFTALKNPYGYGNSQYCT